MSSLVTERCFSFRVDPKYVFAVPVNGSSDEIETTLVGGLVQLLARSQLFG